MEDFLEPREFHYFPVLFSKSDYNKSDWKLLAKAEAGILQIGLLEKRKEGIANYAITILLLSLWIHDVAT